MQMTDSEICRRFRDNRSTEGYIGILAELNDCSQQDIENVLKKNNIALVDRRKKLTAEIKKEKVKVVKEVEKIKLPEIIRKQLEDDITLLRVQMNGIQERIDIINKFLEDNE